MAVEICNYNLCALNFFSQFYFWKIQNCDKVCKNVPSYIWLFEVAWTVTLHFKHILYFTMFSCFLLFYFSSKFWHLWNTIFRGQGIVINYSVRTVLHCFYKTSSRQTSINSLSRFKLLSFALSAKKSYYFISSDGQMAKF